MYVSVAVQSLSCVQLSATPWTVAHQAFLSMGFSRQEYRSGSSRPPPGDLPDPGIEPVSPASAGGFFTVCATLEASSAKKGGDDPVQKPSLDSQRPTAQHRLYPSLCSWTLRLLLYLGFYKQYFYEHWGASVYLN